MRVANNTTPSECNGEEFSQTACGFVVEFADIVENRQMNPSGEYNGQQYYYGWNVDGWPGSELYKYLTVDFFKKLPEELKNVIIETKVVSGHGSLINEPNFTSTDKIYLLSAHEVWEDGTSNRVSEVDTAYNQTRQLDYYANEKVTTNNYSSAIKKPKGSSSGSAWWLRGANSYNHYNFLLVDPDGGWGDDSANNSYGLAPAFRIG